MSGAPEMPKAVSFRFAEADDVPDIVALLANDSLGAGREIAGDPNGMKLALR